MNFNFRKQILRLENSLYICSSLKKKAGATNTDFLTKHERLMEEAYNSLNRTCKTANGLANLNKPQPIGVF